MTFILERVLKLLFIFAFLVLLSTNVYAEKGLFWKVESPLGKVSYLFGTMHTDDNRVTDFSPAVNDALKSVDAFMMETLAPNDTKVFMRSEGRLQDALTEEELNTVYTLAEFHTMHRDATLRMKPWLLAIVFDSSKPLTPFAQDNLLMAKSADLGKEVMGIEDTQAHFGVMDGFSLEEQTMMLKAVLIRTPEQKERDYERLIKAYIAGDIDKLAALDEKITSGMLPPALWAKMRIKLLDERNVVMAERIADKANSKAVFAAVGASHLAGNGGLIARLKKAGFKLSPVRN